MTKKMFAHAAFPALLSLLAALNSASAASLNASPNLVSDITGVRIGRAGPPAVPPPPQNLLPPQNPQPPQNPPPQLEPQHSSGNSRDGNWTTEDVNGTAVARVNASAATTRTNPLADLAKLPKAELTKLLAAILATSPLDSPLPLLFDPKDFLGLRPLTDFVYPFMDPPYNTLLPALTPKPFREGDAPLTRTFDALDVIGKLLGIPGLGKFPLPGLRPLSHFVYPFLPADKYPLLTLLYYLTPPSLRSNEQRDGILDLLKPGVGSLPGAAPVLGWFWPHLDPHFFKPFKPPPRNRVAENQLAENLITRLAELKQRSRK